jgi:hypothetical protein
MKINVNEILVENGHNLYLFGVIVNDEVPVYEGTYICKEESGWTNTQTFSYCKYGLTIADHGTLPPVVLNHLAKLSFKSKIKKNVKKQKKSDRNG